MSDTGEVFSELGGFHAGGASECDGGDGFDAVGSEALECAVVDGHPIDRLFWDGLLRDSARHYFVSL